MRRHRPGGSLAAALLLALALAAGCSDDPVYVQSPDQLESMGQTDDMGNPVPATAQLTLPIRLETDLEATKRAALADQLGVMVPFVKRDDLELSMEWTIKNVSDQDGVARILINGANEYFTYIPDVFVDPTDPDAEPPPPLVGDVPMEVAAGESISGVFREDEFKEADVDLDMITRGNVSPFKALLTNNARTRSFANAAGDTVPEEAFASLVRFDVNFEADTHMVMEFSIRVRDHRSPALLHDELLDAPAGELTTFAPADFAPATPP